MLTLKSIGDLIARRVNGTVTKIEKKILGRAEPKQVKTKSAVILVLTMVVLMTANGFLISYAASWSLIEAVYYWFITFSTIGFGDYLISGIKRQSITKLSFNVSVHQEHKFVDKAVATWANNYPFLYNVLATLNSLFGLCLVSSVLSSIMAALEEAKRICSPECFPRKIEEHANSEQNTQGQQEIDATCLSMEHLQT